MFMDEYYESNKRRWNELVAIHAKSAEYDLDGFLAGKSSLHQVELDALGDVSGKSLLHLQCHFGLDTISWSRLGAKATGVDFSETGIEFAQKLAKRVGTDTRFICSNIYDLPQVLDEQFDIVFTSFGVLCWLGDIEAWGRVITSYLKPGGLFLIVEGHPILWVFDDEHPTDLKIKYSYWHTKAPMRWDTDGTYVETEIKSKHTVTYEWQHTISDVLNAVITSGLTILEVKEYPFIPWKPYPMAKKDETGNWRLDGDPIPLCWSVKAQKP
jgi:SAM-dependent methyltransferase